MKLTINEYSDELVLDPVFAVHKEYLLASTKKDTDMRSFPRKGIPYTSKRSFFYPIWIGSSVSVEAIDETGAK